MKEKKNILLTFDLEEFDLPRKYGIRIEEKEMYRISREGTEKLLDLLAKHKIRATFFITALFAKKYPRLIKKISKEHEIGLHGYAHSDIYKELSREELSSRLGKAKKMLEKISGKKIIAIRSQRLQKIDYNILKKIGIKVDSSLLPTYIPLSLSYTLGRFENLFKSRKVFFEKGIISVPLTVTPFIRIPLLWITFRNLGRVYARTCTALALASNNFVNLIFHPWEFVDISRLKLPYLIKNNTGKKLAGMLEDYIIWAERKGYRFLTMREFLSSCKIL